MSQANINIRERATYVGEETAFGVTPSGSFPNAMTRCFPLGEDVVLGELQQENHDVMDERVRRDDNPDKVKGLKIASKVGPFRFNLKATKTASQLPAAGTPGSLTPRIFLRHALGAEHALAGSTVASAASATALTVAMGEGVNFAKGTIILVENAAHEMEWTKVTNVATDTLTMSPALSGTPINGAIVRNLYNYCRALSNTRSLTFQQCFVGAATADHTVNGCYGNLTFEIPEPGKPATMSLSPTVTDYTEGSQSLTAASASDEMGAAIAWKPLIYLATSLTRGTHLVNEGISLELVEAADLVRDPGVASTVAGIVRVGGRPVSVKVGVKVRFDATYDTNYAAGAAYAFVVVLQSGTGVTASFHVFEVPVAKIVGQPKRTKIGQRLHMELALEGYADTGVTLASETGEDLDRVDASFRYAFG